MSDFNFRNILLDSNPDDKEIVPLGVVVVDKMEGLLPATVTLGIAFDRCALVKEFGHPLVGFHMGKGRVDRLETGTLYATHPRAVQRGHG